MRAAVAEFAGSAFLLAGLALLANALASGGTPIARRVAAWTASLPTG